MATLVERLTTMLDPAVAAAGFDLLGVEFIGAGKQATLRIYIDHEDGVNVDDCALVSHQVSAVLDVEEPISSEYNLEVSSPGMDRPLFTAEHFKQFIGERAKVQLHTPVDNRRKLTGTIAAVSATNEIEFTVDGEPFAVSIDLIKKANLVPRFD